MSSPSKGKSNWVVLLVVGLIAVAIMAFVLGSGSCSRQSAAPEEQTQSQSTEESAQQSDERDDPESAPIALPEI